MENKFDFGHEFYEDKICAKFLSKHTDKGTSFKDKKGPPIYQTKQNIKEQ